MNRAKILTWIPILLAQLVMAGSVQAAADAEAGKVLFDANCASCHGISGQGDGPIAAALTPGPRDFTVGDFQFDADEDGVPGGDADLILVIQNGAMKYGGSPFMAPVPTLTDPQLNDIVAHIRTMKGDEDEDLTAEEEAAPITEAP